MNERRRRGAYARKYIHAVDDDFSTGFQKFIDPAHNIASTRVDDGIERHGLTSFREQLGELIWPILCNDALSKQMKGGGRTTSTQGRKKGEKHTRLVVDTANGTEGGRFLNFILTTTRDEHVRAFGKTELKCDESDAAADACDENALTLPDAGIDDDSSAGGKSIVSMHS